MHRRTALKIVSMGAAAAAAPMRLLAEKRFRLSREDEALLDDIQRRAVRYCVEQAGSESGQVLDRAAAANTDGKLDSRYMASIAATGFGLAGLCIADKRGYLPTSAVRAQVLRTLRFHAEKLPHEHGFFYHFNDVNTGEPWKGVEVSSIDTALLLCGVLTARAYFHNDTEIVRHATAIYERVDWPWMLNGGSTFSMGWHPGKGFLESRWAHYCELMMIPLLAMASPTHPVGPEAWTAWSRPTIEYAGFKYISSHDPLFVHQYSHAYFDFRAKRDAYANYFENSVIATKAHRQFCLDQGAPYSDEYWGISASDSANGYQAWGGPPKLGTVDGSVVPYATAGSLPFTPEICLHVQRSLRAKYPQAWGRYGLCDAFHPQANYYDADVLGIDLGITLLMAENLRTGFVWETFGRNPEVAIAMQKAGFHAAR